MKTKKALSDVSMFDAYDEGTVIKEGTRVVCMTHDSDVIIEGSYGVALESSNNPYVRWENTDFRKSTIGNDNGSTWACYSYLLAPFPDELYNKLVLGVEDVVNIIRDNETQSVIDNYLLIKEKLKKSEREKVLQQSIRFLELFLSKQPKGITNKLNEDVALFIECHKAPRKKYTIEQLREKIGEDFDIVKEGEV